MNPQLYGGKFAVVFLLTSQVVLCYANLFKCPCGNGRQGAKETRRLKRDVSEASPEARSVRWQERYCLELGLKWLQCFKKVKTLKLGRKVTQ